MIVILFCRLNLTTVCTPHGILEAVPMPLPPKDRRCSGLKGLLYGCLSRCTDGCSRRQRPNLPSSQFSIPRETMMGSGVQGGLPGEPDAYLQFRHCLRETPTGPALHPWCLFQPSKSPSCCRFRVGRVMGFTGPGVMAFEPSIQPVGHRFRERLNQLTWGQAGRVMRICGGVLVGRMNHIP